MGNDGGSIPTRRELVKEAARNPTTTELKESQQEKEEYHWSTDPITHKPLGRPVVSDSSGRLYNKDSIIEFLLPTGDSAAKAEADKTLRGAVRSLKDVVEVRFEVDASAEARRNGAPRSEAWICPITRNALGPGSKAVYLVPCGHAFSGSVVREVSEEKCLQCDAPYAPDDVIPIVPTSEADVARLSLRAKNLRERGLTHSLQASKKAPGGKKRRKNGGAKGAAERAGLSAPQLADSQAKAPAGSALTGGIKNAATASITAKVLEEQEARNKRRKTDANENLKSLFSSRDPSKPHGTSSDFMSRGFTIPAHDRR